MCQELYKNNQFLRKPLKIKQLRPTEREFRGKLAKALKNQIHAVVTPEFLSRVEHKYDTLKGVGKAESVDPEDFILEGYIEDQLSNHPEMKPDSDSNNAIKAVLVALILATMGRGLLYDKQRLVEQLNNIGDDRLNEVIAGTNFSDMEITDPEILDFVDKYSGELVVGISAVTAQRIKTFVYNGITRGAKAEELAKQISTLDKISERRAATIARTELANAKAYETRIFYEERGIEYWVWTCNQPEDVGCLINCGVIRRVGESFPSGHDAPTVHPNCQCFMDAYIPDSGRALELFITAILLGRDWSGGDEDIED